jgi:ABC-type dipeptide/oligopeptide/nickel transport system permease component
MIYYIIRRLLMIVPTLIAITMVSFFILQVVPGDPARAMAGIEASEKDVEAIRKLLCVKAQAPLAVCPECGGH